MGLPDNAMKWRRSFSSYGDFLPEIITEALYSAVERRRVHVLRHYESEGFEPEVETLKTPLPGIDLIYALGPIAYHVDADFPRYTYLMVIQNGGLMVEGGAWETFHADPPGTLIALDTHLPHGLRAVGFGGPEDMQTPPWLDKPLSEAWSALSMSSWAPLTQKAVREAFTDAMLHDPEMIAERQ